MQWIHADKGAAASCHLLYQLAQIAEIANPPIILRAQRIKLHVNTPPAFPLG
ncbi:MULTISPECIES: hypothetical protein [Symbiopectobacterium]|uniref:hypothetical protein n=1 Tax=Symbiopectobacterium TaxID=801 RepID=UPI0020796658|nr:hypothetical protein [Candidatus Symbiopectobacterium endolongispinus]